MVAVPRRVMRCTDALDTWRNAIANLQVHHPRHGLEVGARHHRAREIAFVT